MKDLVLASAALTKKCDSSLRNLGFEPIVMPTCDRLQTSVSSHPDMLVFFFGDKYICTAEYYERAREVGIFEKINSLGYSPLLTDEVHGESYPYDVMFNALTVNGKLFCLEKALSNKLRESACDHGLEIVNVHQGYTKCSVCKVSENAIITADDGIATVAEHHGIDVLKVREGHVRLEGYDTGFIGGACGTFGDSVYFCGDIFRHPDGECIKKFCEEHKKSCISLSDEPLFDVGTLFFLSKV